MKHTSLDISVCSSWLDLWDVQRACSHSHGLCNETYKAASQRRFVFLLGTRVAGFTAWHAESTALVTPVLTPDSSRETPCCAAILKTSLINGSGQGFSCQNDWPTFHMITLTGNGGEPAASPLLAAPAFHRRFLCSPEKWRGHSTGESVARML